MPLEPNFPPSGEPIDSKSPLLPSLCLVKLIWRRLRSKSNQEPEMPPPKPQKVIRLPPEVYCHIVSYCVDSIVTTLHVREYRLGRETLSQGQTLLALMRVSKPFSNLVLHAWNRYWPVSAASTWSLARPIVFFELFTYPVDLSSFTHLRFASLDFACAFRYSDGAWHNLPFRAVLPPAIEEIELLWSHAPLPELIDIVREHCPRVTTLRIVPCTMFNHPSCAWWSGHQFSGHHDHYMKGANVVEVIECARVLVSGIRDLVHLRNLHIGYYFVPFEAANTHRSAGDHVRYHSIKDSDKWIDGVHTQSIVQFNAKWAADHPGIPPPNVHLPRLADRRLWSKSCPRCIEQWLEVSERAERVAASVLAAELPQLETVSFSSFAAEQRVAPSEWVVGRVGVPFSPSGEQQAWIRTKRPGTPCSTGKHLLFRLSGTRWICTDHE
ncbi:hypothetical protein RhiLY_01279 [Ceratobasidium sp. AG-Ba]|nr:hypothetical protein RhiLY_01279 [Ceratobasidium sp. AG-Ba]